MLVQHFLICFGQVKVSVGIGDCYSCILKALTEFTSSTAIYMPVICPLCLFPFQVSSYFLFLQFDVKMFFHDEMIFVLNIGSSPFFSCFCNFRTCTIWCFFCLTYHCKNVTCTIR